MADLAPPVILLAFARSEDPRFQGLPRLPEEARLLREALEPAEAAGQIKLEIRQDATLNDILRAFDRYRGRVAIFHFAGHTDDQSLLAEQLLGAEALLAAVHAQSELKLVFLNVCENQAQAAGLHAAGVPAAIVTSEEIEDDLCPTFAMRFYRALASGFTLAEAFDKARLAAKGEAYEQPGRFDHGPWLLSTADPAAGDWRLPPSRPSTVVPYHCRSRCARSTSPAVSRSLRGCWKTSSPARLSPCAVQAAWVRVRWRPRWFGSWHPATIRPTASPMA